MSRRITLRLTDDEYFALHRLVKQNETVGFEKPSEFLRLLLLRERVRRGEVFPPQFFRTSVRIGRDSVKRLVRSQTVSRKENSPALSVGFGAYD